MTASFTNPHVGLVVEGVGDLGALPVLLRKYLESGGDYRDVLGKPVPCHGRSKAMMAGGIEAYVATAGSRPGCVGVLVVLDGEGDCVRTVGPALLERARSITHKPVQVALADRDFESWIYASAETLGIEGLEYDPNRNGQGAISAALKPTKYVKPVWQPRLTHRLDMSLASCRSISLARALARFDELVRHLPSSCS